MKINFLYAEKVNDKIRIYIEINGQETYFDTSEFMFLNDIGKLL